MSGTIGDARKRADEAMALNVITPEERAEWRYDAELDIDANGCRPEYVSHEMRILSLLEALEATERQLDAARLALAAVREVRAKEHDA